MSRKNALFAQTIVELLIPIVGYFSWRWNYNFILLFYLIDLLLLLGLTVAKAKKRMVYAGTSEQPVFYRLYFTSFAIFAAAVALIILARMNLNSHLQIGKEVVDFLLYKDMGVEQGYVLVPLIVLNGVLLYRQEYLMTAKYRVQDMRALLLPVLRQAFALFGFAALLLGLSALILIPEIVLVLSTIVGIAVYRWFFLRNL